MLIVDLTTSCGSFLLTYARLTEQARPAMPF